ncbi:MAG: hypothetical protein GC180_11860 [Bacteroidetes bacterium]|nr:hypothetical protein [Bacteroidota bacterium]
MKTRLKIQLLLIVFSIGLTTSSSAQQNDKDSSQNYNSFSTRYFQNSNALAMKKGDYYVMTHIAGPEIQYAATKNLSVGLISSWLASPMIATIRYTIPTKNKKVNFGIGTMFGTTGYLNNFRGFGGYHYGMMTIGDYSKNLTVSAGYVYCAPGNTYSRKVPGTYTGIKVPLNPTRDFFSGITTSISGMMKIGEKTSIVLDATLLSGRYQENHTDANYTYSSDNTETIEVKEIPSQTTFLYLMPGIRFQKSENKAFQLALAGLSVFPKSRSTYTIPVPVCSWFVKF